MPITERIKRMTPGDWARAAGVGILTAIFLSAVMMVMQKTGLSPLPGPLGPAFAERLVGHPLPLPAGLLFHVVYVTFWSIAFVTLYRDDLSFSKALLLALALWIGVLVVFFPVVGWGFFGLGIGPKLIIGSLIPHLLFAAFLWGLCRMMFAGNRPDAAR